MGPLTATTTPTSGTEIVGGYLASFEIEASNAAHLGLRILAGEKPREMALGESTSCAWMFDWRQVKRWNIDEKKLPPGSMVRFRNPGFWDLYQWHVIGVFSLCVVEALLIFALLLQRARAGARGGDKAAGRRRSPRLPSRPPRSP